MTAAAASVGQGHHVLARAPHRVCECLYLLLRLEVHVHSVTLFQCGNNARTPGSCGTAWTRPCASFTIGTGSWLQTKFVRRLNMPAEEKHFAPIKRNQRRCSKRHLHSRSRDTLGAVDGKADDDYNAFPDIQYAREYLFRQVASPPQGHCRGSFKHVRGAASCTQRRIPFSTTFPNNGTSTSITALPSPT